MTPEQHQRLKQIVFAASALDGAQRHAYLDDACGQDDRLRGQVESLLGDGHDATLAIQLPTDSEDDRAPPGTAGADAGAASPAATGHIRGALDVAVEDWLGIESTPDRIGPFRIEKTIGRGGMGTVYLARQQHPNREVALKVIRPGMLSPRLVRRFQLEVNMLGQLHHPGIAQIFEAGVADTRLGPRHLTRLPYFAMEFVRGVPLNTYATQQQPDVARRLTLMAQVCEAVHHAHQKGVVHRDLKPGNVLINEAGQPKIVDFGVARATDGDLYTVTLQTEVGQLIGTLPYMSPEQATGRSEGLDTRSDVYALGVMLYELLAGKLPYDLRNRSIPEATRVIQEEDPSRLSSVDTRFRGDIETIVAKALEKDKERRYTSAAELAADIRRYLGDEPIQARPASTMYQLRKFAKRHKTLVGGAVATLVVLVAGIVSTSMLAVRANRLAETARTNELLAAASAAEARHTAYRASVAAAAAAFSLHDPLSAARHLDAAPEALRNWEWRHIARQLDPVLATATLDVGEDARFAAGIAFLPDGTPLAASIDGSAVRLTNLLSLERLAEIDAGGPARCPTLSPDGSMLAAVLESERELVVWHVETAEPLLAIPSPERDPVRVSFSPDGSVIEVCGENRISVLDRETGRTLMTCDMVISPRYHRAVFSSDGSRYVVCSRQGDSSSARFRVFDTRSGSLVQQTSFIDITGAMALSPDGRTLVLGTDDRSRFIRELDATTLEQVGVLRGHTDAVTGLSFSPDGGRLASVANGVLRVWDMTTRQSVGGHPLEDVAAESITFSPDASRVVVSDGRRVQVLALQQNSATVLRGHPTYVYLIAIHPDGTMIASADFNRQLRLWDAITGEPLAATGSAGSSALGFTRDGSKLIVMSGGPYATVWDWASWQQSGRPMETAEFLRIACGGAKRGGSWQGEGQASSPDGSLFVHPAPRGAITVRELAGLTELRTLAGHDGAVRALAVSPDNAMVVSGGDDQTVRAWDVATGAQLAVMRGHTSVVYSVNVSPDGTRIVSGGNDNNIILWDANTFERVAELHGHTAYVHSLAFSPDGTQLVSGSGDSTVRVWDTVPRADRMRQARAERTLRRQVEPLVEGLLDELGPADEVADRLRGDGVLTEPQRAAALRVLLRRSEQAARSD